MALNTKGGSGGMPVVVGSGNSAVQPAPGEAELGKQTPEQLQTFISDVQARIEAADPAKFPAKEKAKARQMIGTITNLMKAGSVTWESGANIGAPQTAAIKQALEQNPDVKTMVGMDKTVIIVLGFADTTGNSSSNLELSQSRAKAVVTEIKNLGFDNPIESYGIGETSIVNEADQKKNRAAEIWVARGD